MPSRRGFFTFLAALPFAPKCILAMRPKSASAYAYRENGHTFYALGERPSQMILDEQRYLDYQRLCAAEIRVARQRDRWVGLKAVLDARR